ncbi:MAG TPA: MmcQ/YjbR family DNA-binding protein [Candidatus Aquilonibacter sp.]|nr:MmcQ/YjbR family DNA-binding protein [Candidatus Aquilonibacter sp.]
MNVDSVRAYGLSFPNAKEKLQWGDDLCFKIGGKIFLILGLDTRRLCFKCTPDAFAELIEREDIHPAPYVGRYKWVMLDRLDALRDHELEELIRQSYEMVAAKAPKKKSRTKPPRTGARKSTKSKKKRRV